MATLSQAHYFFHDDDDDDDDDDKVREFGGWKSPAESRGSAFSGLLWETKPPEMGVWGRSSETEQFLQFFSGSRNCNLVRINLDYRNSCSRWAEKCG